MSYMALFMLFNVSHSACAQSESAEEEWVWEEKEQVLVSLELSQLREMTIKSQVVLQFN